MTGYGLYWYCLELIAGNVDQKNITFELEHDAEIIAHDTGINVQLVNEMMAYMIDLGLFENRDGVISCLKMASRLDQSMTSNPEMRKIINGLKGENHDTVMTKSIEPIDGVMQDKTRLDKTNKPSTRSRAKVDDTPYELMVDIYHRECPQQNQCLKLTEPRKKRMKAFWSMLNKVDDGKELTAEQRLARYLSYVNSNTYLPTKRFADLHWLMQEDRFLEIKERKYDREESFD